MFFSDRKVATDVSMLRTLAFVGLLACSQALPSPTPKGKAVVPQPKLNGGEEVSISQFPFQVALYFEGGFICGGSIIGSEYILTAAQCFELSSTEYDYTIRAGIDDAQKLDDDVAVYMVKSIIKHPNYYFGTTSIQYDVAVVEVTRAIQYTDTIQPISLFFDPVVIDDQVTVSGFGDNEDQGTDFSVLKAVTIPVVEKEACQNEFKELGVTIGDDFFCAGVEGKGSCMGDGGSPVILGDYQVGIASLQYKCSETSTPSVFTQFSNPKIASFLQLYV